RISDSPLASFDVRRRYGVSVVALRREGEDSWDIADQDVTLYADDEILIAGSPREVEDFSTLDEDEEDCSPAPPPPRSDGDDFDRDVASSGLRVRTELVSTVDGLLRGVSVDIGDGNLELDRQAEALALL